jgi:mono/diheme cytochrome c family protein
VLAVILFIAFWVIVALGVFTIAFRGGGGGAREAVRRTPGGRIAGGLALAFVYVAFGVGIPIALLTGNHANASEQIGGLKLTAAEKSGRALFGDHCGVCHTLAAANAIGKVGPNLDQIAPSYSLIIRTLANGCLQNAPPTSLQSCLGDGTMPAGILEGRDATEVASFVSRVAGKE